MGPSKARAQTRGEIATSVSPSEARRKPEAGGELADRQAHRHRRGLSRDEVR